MKNLRGLILLFLGSFLLAFAVFVRFIVAPAAVKAPLQIPDKYRNIIASGEGFLFLNSKTLQTDTVSVWITRHVQGDVKAGDRKVAVYEESLCLSADDGTHPGCLSEGDPRLITISTDRIAFDRKSGLPVKDKKYQASVDGDTRIEHTGLGYKFPIDTKKKSYPFFDTVVGKSFPAVYSGTEKIHGMKVYKFVQTIKDQPVYTNHVLPSIYSNTRTVYVEPTTGVIINGSEDLNQMLTGRASLDPTSAVTAPELAGKTALKGLLAFTDATVRNQMQLAKDNLPKIHAVRLWLPLISALLGLVLLALAFFVMRPAAGRSPAIPVPAGQGTAGT